MRRQLITAYELFPARACRLRGEWRAALRTLSRDAVYAEDRRYPIFILRPARGVIKLELTTKLLADGGKRWLAGAF